MAYQHWNFSSTEIYEPGQLCSFGMSTYSHFSVQCDVTAITVPVVNCTIKIQESLDGLNWHDIPDVLETITTTGIYLMRSSSHMGQCRAYVSMDSGEFTVTTKVNVKD